MALIPTIGYLSLFTYALDSTPASVLNLSASDTYNILEFNATGQQVNLPDPATTITAWNNVIKYTGTGTLLITPAAGTIDGAPSLTLNQYETVQIISNGVGNYITLTKFTAITSKNVQWATTGIVDGTFSRNTINGFTNVLNFNNGQYATMKAQIPKEYIPGTAFNFKVAFAPNNTNAGNFTWTLNYQFLQPGQVITATPSNVSAVTASSAVTEQQQILSLKIPNSTVLNTDTTLLLQLVATAVPGGTRALGIHMGLSYASNLFSV